MGAAACGCAIYFLVSSEVPLVLFFIPVGEVSRENSPTMFWLFVAGHVILGVVCLVCFFWGAAKSRESASDR